MFSQQCLLVANLTEFHKPLNSKYIMFILTSGKLTKYGIQCIENLKSINLWYQCQYQYVDLDAASELKDAFTFKVMSMEATYLHRVPVMCRSVFYNARHSPCQP